MNIFIDIETIPNQSPDALQECIKNVKAPAQYKKPESIEKWLEDNKASKGEEDWKKTSLNGNGGEIIAICFATDNGEVVKLSRELDKPESNLLVAFNMQLHDALKGRSHVSKPYFIGHNVRGFDVPFLFKRLVINNIKPLFEFKPHGRHGSDLFDTMEAWEGFNGRIKLDTLSKILKVGTKTEGIDGSMVWDEVKKGNIKKVTDYCAQDVYLVRDIYNKIAFKEVAA